MLKKVTSGVRLMMIGLCLLIAGSIAYLFVSKRMPQRIRWTGNSAHYITDDTNIIFDLNDTLFTIHKRKALSCLGLGDVLGYFLSGKRTEDIEQKMFQVIDSIRPQTLQLSDKVVQPMHNGKPLPALMQEWMLGSITSQELIDTVTPHIKHLANEGFFDSKREERIITQAILILLDPQTRCDLYEPIKRGINLIKQCKKLGHKVYLLSNMDTELINLLSAKYPDIFELFDGVIISADVNAIKPYKDIYEYTLATYHLDPERSYFIDDEQENLLGAQKVGIKGIQCDHKHYKRVTHQLRTLGLLDKPKLA